jgi:hypothetical protein
MNNEEWRKYVIKEKKKYKKIGYVICPAFFDEKIYFNKHGFNHLIRKMGKPRPVNEQIRRIKLIPHALDILRSSDKVKVEKTNVINGYTAEFWSFSKKIGQKCIKVIVRQLKNGNKHFFSIMDKNVG